MTLKDSVNLEPPMEPLNQSFALGQSDPMPELPVDIALQKQKLTMSLKISVILN